MAPSDLALPKGSLVIVSGANGYIGSHIVDQLLELGYNVRGTVRAEKPWLNEMFEEKYGKGRFETAVVPTMNVPEAFDEAVKGAAGFIHVATDTSMGSDPDQVVTTSVNGIKHALEAAAREPSIKRFVLTSSSAATLNPPLNTKIDIELDSWNEPSLVAAYDPNVPEQMKPAVVYAASKTKSEKEAWNFVKTQKPGFVFNAVLPNMNMGTVLHKEIHGSTMGWIGNLLKGDTMIMGFPPEFYINVVDCARLHVIGLLDPSVHEERIFGFAGEFNWTDVIGHLKKFRPNNTTLPPVPENEGRDLSTIIGAKRAEELLKSFYGQEGWVGLEKSLKDGIDTLGL